MTLTVRALKDIIKDWPERDDNGELTETWVQTHNGVSSEALTTWPLNRRLDDEGRPFYDMLISTEEQ